MNYILFSLLAFFAFVGIKQYIKIANKLNITDRPDLRRVHLGVVPRGVGIVLSFLFVGFYTVNKYLHYNLIPISCNGIVIVFFLTSLFFFIEDLLKLSIKKRMLVQLLVIGFGVFLLKDIIDFIMPFLPFWIKVVMIFIGWLWYLNLYNFMDGLDGITALQTIIICVYIIALAIIVKPYKNIATADSRTLFIDNEEVIEITDRETKENVYFLPAQYNPESLENNLSLIYSVIILMLTFLYFNGNPAKVFIGDSGSIGFGFLTGFLLIKVGHEYGILSAFAGVMYYIMDSTITILWRIKDKEQISMPHLRHFFQKAKRSGMSDWKINFIIFLTNLVNCSLGIVIAINTQQKILCTIIFLIIFFITSVTLGLFEYKFRKFVKNQTATLVR